MARHILAILLAGFALAGAEEVCAEEEECVSQLQTAPSQHWPAWEPPSCCKMQAGHDVIAECEYTDINALATCLTKNGGFENKPPFSYDTKFEHHGHEPGKEFDGARPKVFLVHNPDDEAKVKDMAPCLGEDPFGVTTDYVMNCFGQDNHECTEQGCVVCTPGGAGSPPDAKCNFKPHESKYVVVWLPLKKSDEKPCKH